MPTDIFIFLIYLFFFFPLLTKRGLGGIFFSFHSNIFLLLVKNIILLFLANHIFLLNIFSKIFSNFHYKFHLFLN